MIPLEVPVETMDGVHAARRGGAARIELCAALGEGGLTPSAGLMHAAARAGVPVFAMIRPRAGLFQWSADEAATMARDIRTAREAGLAGVVLGAQRGDLSLDTALLAGLVREAGPMEVTLHRVIDTVPGPLSALEVAVGLGIGRVLSSGAAPTAVEGGGMLAAMVAQAAGRLTVMAGSGVNARNVAALVAETGVAEVHASCSAPSPGAAPFGFDPPKGRRITEEARVREMVATLAAISDR
ncbi:copper homeostasis protein CutC [Roseisalinus antarcticus]|uniref:PF03932 family protein CutC n=1 Tax=Roseisalinus antarcticus TaxID=254357 RepID=A0A1Y5SY77_9RHOB|nr:copper homeostasis protein CutC [Roseisalinus antarcticus]SLN51457.1 Copper homeostasis protein CutC [Roseisalinus antarcticus]